MKTFILVDFLQDFFEGKTVLLLKVLGNQLESWILLVPIFYGPVVVVLRGKRRTERFPKVRRVTLPHRGPVICSLPRGKPPLPPKHEELYLIPVTDGDLGKHARLIV